MAAHNSPSVEERTSLGYQGGKTSARRKKNWKLLIYKTCVKQMVNAGTCSKTAFRAMDLSKWIFLTIYSSVDSET